MDAMKTARYPIFVLLIELIDVLILGSVLQEDASVMASTTAPTVKTKDGTSVGIHHFIDYTTDQSTTLRITFRNVIFYSYRNIQLVVKCMCDVM